MFVNRNNTYNVLMMGPLIPPFNGQSIAFSTLVSGVKERCKVKVLDISNCESVFKNIFLFFLIIFNVLFVKYDKIYFTCSRTFFGSIRDVLLMSLAKFRGIFIVNHLHGSDFKSFYRDLPLLYQKLYYWCYSSIDATIVLVDGMQSEFLDFPNMKIFVVSNCYNKDLDKLPVHKERVCEEIRLLYLSNIMRSKGIMYLLYACDILFARYPKLRLNIAGSFLDDTDSTMNEITLDFMSIFESISIKYPNRIEYLGVCNGNPKLELLWNSDVFILPTFYKTEAFPISILEAMRAGNFILSTKHKFIPQIVDSNIGILFLPKSVEEIVSAIESVINDENAMMKCQNYNIKYSIEKYNEVKYIDSVCQVMKIL